MSDERKSFTGEPVDDYGRKTEATKPAAPPKPKQKPKPATSTDDAE